MMKQSVFLFAIAFMGQSAHAQEQSETQCVDTVGWVDSEGDGCDWYGANDLPGCPYYGYSWDGGMGVADDNCCFCAGTVASSPPVQWPTFGPWNVGPWPTSSPTVSDAPTTSAAPSVCIGSTVGWVDSFGDGCDWYEVHDLPGCPYAGYMFDGGMGVADENCCYCAGTGAPSTPVQYPTNPPAPPTPTSPPTPYPSEFPTTTDPACGYGHVGDGMCTGAKLCCSVYGWCGYGVDYCGSNKFVPDPTASPTRTASPTASLI